MGKYLGSTGLSYLWGKIKSYFAPKPLVIEVDETDTTVTSGTYASITAALAAGRDVIVDFTNTDRSWKHLSSIFAVN